MNKLDLINNIFAKARLGYLTSFTDIILSGYPQNNIFHLFDEAINIFSREEIWDWSETVTTLEYFPAFESYYLSDFEIDPNRIKKRMFYFENGQKQEIRRCEKERFKQLYKGHKRYGCPENFSIENEILEFYPIPDKDYQIQVPHYKHIPLLISEKAEVDFIPEYHQNPIIDYISTIFSALLDKRNAKNFLDDYLRSLSLAKKSNAQYLTKSNTLPSRIRW